MSSLHERTERKEGEKNYKREGVKKKLGVKREGENQVGASPIFPVKEVGRGKLFSPRRQSYPACTVPAQQECNLWVFSTNQLSLHKERKKSNTYKRWGERRRQVKISLPSNHVWAAEMALSVLFPGHSKAPTVLIIPITRQSLH